MRPIDIAKDYFGTPELFDAMVEGYMEHGFVYSGIDAFAMAMPHSMSLLIGQNLNKDVDKCDCWYIQYVTGSLKRLMELLDGLPYKFEYIVFERSDNRNRAYKITDLMEKIHGKA